MKKGRWTSDALHRLMDLRLAGWSWDDIGAELNRKPVACAWRHNYETQKRSAERARKFAVLAEVSRKYEADNASKLAAFARLSSAIPPSRKSIDGPSSLVRSIDIHDVVERGASVVLPPPTEKRCGPLVGGIDIHDIAERGATAVLCGDPKPGRSALDEKRRT